MDARATSKAARNNGFALVELHPEGVLVRTRAGETRGGHGPATAFRAGRDVIVVALSIQGRWRRWEVPAAPEAVQGFVDALRARGITVAPDVGLGSVAGFLAGAVVARGAAVGAAGLVLGALANIVLAVTDRGGSLLVGFACLGGGCSGRPWRKLERGADGRFWLW